MNGEWRPQSPLTFIIEKDYTNVNGDWGVHNIISFYDFSSFYFI